MNSKSPKAFRGTMRIYDLTIDLGSETVKRSGRLIALTPREYDLLMLLVAHQGQIVTRRQVLEHFYGDDPEAAGQSNIVDVYIRLLRKKIDESFWPRLILTRRRQGYLLRGGRARPA